MLFKDYKLIVKSDLYRCSPDKADFDTLIKKLIFGDAFKYVFWLRTCSYTRSNSLLKYTVYPLSLFMLKRYKYKFGIDISHSTKIGSGFYIGHFGGIVVHTNAVIGKNCNISHGVTIGQTNRGDKAGCPSIGDNVYIGPGAKIVGDITIGNNAAIGANSVITKDIPNNAVAVGIPGKVISYDSSAGYVNNTDYDHMLEYGSGKSKIPSRSVLACITGLLASLAYAAFS